MSPVVTFFRSRPGRGYLAYLAACALLAAVLAFGIYKWNAASYEKSKGEEGLTALQLIEAFVSSYAAVHGWSDTSAATPVPSSFRAAAIERFNHERDPAAQLSLRMVGVSGREIAIPPSDREMAEAVSRFVANKEMASYRATVTFDGRSYLRTLYASLATQQSCVDCHNQLQAGKEAWHLGDVMGAFVIDVPRTAFDQSNAKYALLISSTSFLFSALVGLYIFTLHHRQLAERTKTEDALRAGEARFRGFAESASDWYWETDRDHRVIHISDRVRDHGIAPQHWLGRRLHALILDSAADERQALIPELAGHRAVRDLKLPISTVDGVKHISLSAIPIVDASGQFNGYRGSARDISLSVRAAENLQTTMRAAEAASRLKSEFLANMSHELRTPLNAIIGFSEVIHNDMLRLNCPAQYREYAQDIYHSGSHLLDIINDILDMSKIEAGKLELREGTIDLSQLARECLHLVEQKVVAGNIAVTIEAPPDSIHVYADPIRLKQVLLNLLTNAIKFTPAGGRVMVGFGTQDDGQVKLWVADTGIGMSAEEIETALQPFRQVDSALARKYEGTGLGLPLVKALVELHGGGLQIESVPGTGTKVTVLLPMERLETEIQDERAMMAAG